MINAVTGVQAIVINTAENIKTEENQLQKEQPERINISAQKSNSQNTEKSAVSTTEKKLNYNDLANSIQSLLGEQNIALEFKMDDETKKMILRIIDSNTKEVIQQVPPEIALKVAKFVADQLGNGQVADAKI